MPTNLSDLIQAGGNLKFTTVALTGNSGSSSQAWPQNIFFSTPFNAKFQDPYNICTVNTSLSTITLPAGLYRTGIYQWGKSNSATDMSVRLRTGSITLQKWPIITTTGGAMRTDIFEGGFYLSTQSDISYQMRWGSAGTTTFDRTGLMDDGDMNVFIKMDIFKLK